MARPCPACGAKERRKHPTTGLCYDDFHWPGPPQAKLWRTGTKVYRTIYAITGTDHDRHILIGMMDNANLAANAVEAHNFQLLGVRSPLYSRPEQAVVQSDNQDV